MSIRYRSATQELIDAIQTEIDEDVRLANGEDEQAHNQRHWPDRIERQAQAFRRILQLHTVDSHGCVICGIPCSTVDALARVYDLGVAMSPVARPR